MHNVRALVKARTGNVPEVHVVTWSRLHAYAEIPYWMVVLIVFLLFADVHLMTVARSPVRKIISDSDDDEENVPSWLSGVSLGTTLISLKQYRGLDSGRRYASFISRQLPVACSTSGTVLQAMGSWVRALEQGNRCASFALLAEAWHYFLCSCQPLASALLYTGS